MYQAILCVSSNTVKLCNPVHLLHNPVYMLCNPVYVLSNPVYVLSNPVCVCVYTMNVHPQVSLVFAGRGRTEGVMSSFTDRSIGSSFTSLT